MKDWDWLSSNKKPNKVTKSTFVFIAIIIIGVYFIMNLSMVLISGNDNCKKILSSFDENKWSLTDQKYKDDYAKCGKGDLLSLISVGWDYWGGGFTP